MSGVQMKESEQKALAEQALADFAAAEGIALEPKRGGRRRPTPARRQVHGPDGRASSAQPWMRFDPVPTRRTASASPHALPAWAAEMVTLYESHAAAVHPARQRQRPLPAAARRAAALGIARRFSAARAAAALRRGAQLRSRQRPARREGRRDVLPVAGASRKTPNCRKAPRAGGRGADALLPLHRQPRAARQAARCRSAASSRPPTSSRRRCPAASNYDLNSLALLMRDWADDPLLAEHFARDVPRSPRTSTTCTRCW